MTFLRSGAASRRTRNGSSSARRAALALTFALACVSTACKTDGYELPSGGGGGDGGPGDGDGGMIDAGGGTIDASIDATPGPDACPVEVEGPSNPSSCDGKDNDCDTNIDEGFQLDKDPANCGACGIRCDALHTTGLCVDSECDLSCLPGFYNYDENPDCEYQCVPDGDDTECDFRDNDCDTRIDEGVNTDTDEDNCGGCGSLCRPIHAVADCEGGECGYSACDDGYADVLPSVPGCEYQCPENPPLAQEECDGQDDDCDGKIDELPITGLGLACSDFPEGNTGTCKKGHTECSFGAVVCVDDVGPVSETCDGKDNDCDASIDETFNKQTDVNNCGTCGHVCSIPNAVAKCQTGTCKILACNSGWVDSDGDGDPVEGCDYQCTKTGPEVCDGLDNDCDKKTDGADPDMTTPANFCRTAGQCSSMTPTCAAGPCGGPTQWRCVYGGNNQEVDSCGNLKLQEALCDSKDGDCDGHTDETFVLKGSDCSDGEFGECADTGTYVCKADKSGLKCNATDTHPMPGTPEVCDNQDNDCDQKYDEDAPAETVLIDDGAGGLASFYIYAYEASHPDATDLASGSADQRTCSNPGVIPWKLISRVDAQAECAKSGRRLCTEAEWELACKTLADNTYPYGDPYEAQTCNGRDYDTDSGTAGNQDDVIPTGELDQCFADWADGPVYDLSGNLKEWTSTQVNTGVYRVRGGSYDNIRQGLTCDFDFISFDEDIELPNLGFRCCSATP